MSEKIDEKSIVCWGALGDEELTHEDMNDAIADVLDAADELPETLEIQGFARVKVTLLGNDILENILESLDDKYGGRGEDAEPTREMGAAAEIFTNAILEEYVPWRCEAVISKTIDVNKWVKEHAPHWLDDKK